MKKDTKILIGVLVGVFVVLPAITGIVFMLTAKKVVEKSMSDEQANIEMRKKSLGLI